MPAKRYKATLTDEERQNLLASISKGKAAAHKLARARILLQADQAPKDPLGLINRFSKLSMSAA